MSSVECHACDEERDGRCSTKTIHSCATEGHRIAVDAARSAYAILDDADAARLGVTIGGGLRNAAVPVLAALESIEDREGIDAFRRMLDIIDALSGKEPVR